MHTHESTHTNTHAQISQLGRSLIAHARSKPARWGAKRVAGTSIGGLAGRLAVLVCCWPGYVC